MGDIADAIAAGSLCRWCGLPLAGEPEGEPRACNDCACADDEHPAEVVWETEP